MKKLITAVSIIISITAIIISTGAEITWKTAHGLSPIEQHMNNYSLCYIDNEWVWGVGGTCNGKTIPLGELPTTGGIDTTLPYVLDVVVSENKTQPTNQYKVNISIKFNSVTLEQANAIEAILDQLEPKPCKLDIIKTLIVEGDDSSQYLTKDNLFDYWSTRTIPLK